MARFYGGSCEAAASAAAGGDLHRVGGGCRNGRHSTSSRAERRYLGLADTGLLPRYGQCLFLPSRWRTGPGASPARSEGKRGVPALPCARSVPKSCSGRAGAVRHLGWVVGSRTRDDRQDAEASDGGCGELTTAERSSAITRHPRRRFRRRWSNDYEGRYSTPREAAEKEPEAATPPRVLLRGRPRPAGE